MTNKIKLIAIAKNEAPYLAEWIFHHLYFGFNEIEVLVNRTTDNTSQLMTALGDRFNNVTWRYVDWVDLADSAVAAHIQHIAYADAFARNRDSCSHIMFLDVDEFWTPSNLEDNIHDCMQRIGNASSVYFEWMTEAGHNQEFSPLQNNHPYKLSRLGKSIINTQSKFKSLDIHKPRFALFDETVLADGRPYKSAESEGLNHQFIARELSSLKAYFVIHRMSRSELEYLSIIYRGNPSGQSSFKLNRSTGYEKSTDDSILLSFPQSAWRAYENARALFYEETGVSDAILEAQTFVRNRAELALGALPEAIKSEPAKIRPLLEGLTNKALLQALNK